MNPSNLIKSFWSYWTVGRLGIVFPLWRFSCLNMTRMHGLLLFAHVGERKWIRREKTFDRIQYFFPFPRISILCFQSNLINEERTILEKVSVSMFLFGHILDQVWYKRGELCIKSFFSHLTLPPLFLPEILHREAREDRHNMRWKVQYTTSEICN